jgi:hypothetical protein
VIVRVLQRFGDGIYLVSRPNPVASADPFVQIEGGERVFLRGSWLCCRSFGLLRPALHGFDHLHRV